MPLAALELCPVPAGRHLTFVNKPGEKVHVYRRQPGQSLAWELVARHAHSPFLDLTGFAAGTTLEYHVQHFTMEDAYLGHSPVERIVVREAGFGAS